MFIPKEVADRKQWMLWRLEYGTKVPYQPSGVRAKSNSANTWSTLEEVQAKEASYSGLAFVFSGDDGLCGVDLDKCYKDGQWEPWAQEILDRFKGVAYAEISPSGTGVKLTTRAKKPEGARCQNNKGVECYDTARFWTWTQDCLGDGYREIGDGQEAIDWLLETHLAGARGETGKKRLEPIGSFKLLARAESYVDSCTPGSKGNLRNSAFSIAGHLHSLVENDGERLSDTEVFSLLRRWNTRNTDQLREDELREAAVNGRKNGTPPADKPPEEPQPTADVDLSGILSEIVDETPEDIPFSPGDFPRDAIPTDGIIGQVIEYNLSSAMLPQPELALAGALALMSVLTGRKVEDEFGTRTNLYLLGLGESGSGKEHARKVNKDLLYRIGADECVAPERLASSAGLTVAVRDRLACLFQLDEIGHLLATMKNPSKAAHLFNIGTVLMQMYSSSDSVWIGDAYADSKKTPTINQPHAVVYGTTTPEGFWSTLSADNVANGLLGRMLVFESPGRVKRRKTLKKEPPEELIESLKWWWDLKLGIDKSVPVLLKAQKTDEASKRFEEHLEGIDDRHDKEPADRAAVWSRTGEKTAKLALIFACSRQQFASEILIELEDVDRAIKISNWLTRRMLKQAYEYVAENFIEHNKKRVLRAIGKQISMRDLSRRTQWLRAKERSEILIELQDRGDIEIIDVKTSGRTRRDVRRLCQ